MPYQSTGRRPGRPKTKEYVTLMARVPKELADMAKRYGALRQQTISVVLRDALESLVEEDRYKPFMSDANALPENVSDMNTMPENVSDMNGVQAIVSDMNTEQAIVSDMKTEETAVPPVLRPCGHPLERYNPKTRVCRECNKVDAQLKRDARKAKASA